MLDIESLTKELDKLVKPQQKVEESPKDIPMETISNLVSAESYSHTIQPGAIPHYGTGNADLAKTILDIGETVWGTLVKEGARDVKLVKGLAERIHSKEMPQIQQRIEEAKADIDSPFVPELSKARARIALPILEGGAKVRNTVMDFINEMDRVQTEAGEQAYEPKMVGGKIVDAGLRAGLGVAKIAALTLATKNPITAMAGLNAIETTAAGGNIKDISYSAASGGILGAVFMGTQFLPKIYSLPTNGLIFGGMKAQELAAERGGLANLTDEDRQDVLVEGLIGTYLATIGKQLNWREFKEVYKNRGFNKQQFIKAEQRIAQLVGTDIDRANLKEALVNAIEKESTAAPAPKEPKQLGLKLGKVARQKPEAKPSEEAIRTIEEAQLKEIGTQAALDFPEMQRPAPPSIEVVKPEYKPTAKALEISKGLREDERHIDNKLAKETEAKVQKEKGERRSTESRLIKDRFLENTGMGLDWKKYDRLPDEEAAFIRERFAQEYPNESPMRLNFPPEMQAKYSYEEYEKMWSEETLPIEKPVPAEEVGRTGVLVSKELQEAEDKIITTKREMAKLRKEDGTIDAENENAFSILERGLAAQERRATALQMELRDVHYEEAKKANPGLSIEEFEDFRNTAVRTTIDGTEGLDAIEVTKKVTALKEQKQAFQDVRKNLIPAFKLTETGQVLSFDSWEKLNSQLIGRKPAEVIRLGHVDPTTGDFFDESLWNGGPIESVRLVPEKTISNKKVGYVLSKLMDIRGGLSSRPSPKEIPIDALQDVIEIRKLYKPIMKAAKKAGMTTEEYLRNKGFSQTAIDFLHKLMLTDIAESELITKATKKQKQRAHEIAATIGVDHREVAQSIGIPRDKSMTDYSVDEGIKLITELERRYAEKTGESEPAENIKERLFNDVEGKSSKIKYILSPEIALRKTEAGRGIVQEASRSQTRIRMHTQYLFANEEWGVEDARRLADNKEHARNMAKRQENLIDDSALSPQEREGFRRLKAAYDHMLQFRVDQLVRGDKKKFELVEAIAKKIKYYPNENADKVDATIAAYKKEYSLSNDEVEAVNLLRMRIEHYLPHVWDKKAYTEILVKKMELLKSEGEQNTATYKRYTDLLIDLKGGKFVQYNALPKEITMQYFKERHGMQGYLFDAGIAFDTYVYSWMRKVYMEPALRRMATYYIDLPAADKPYAFKFIRDYMGWGERHEVADFIKQFEWFRTLSSIPGTGRSPITNITQQLNTIVDLGPEAWYEGVKKASASEGIAQFKATGLSREVLTVQYSGEENLLGTSWDRARYYGGITFNLIEFHNRATAYHAGLYKAKQLGHTGEDAFWYAVDAVHRTQFEYGKAGMPMAMRGWLGTITQFSSYTIKQSELLYKWSKEPGGWLKILSFMGLSQLLQQGMKSLAGVDLSNALGISVDPHELVKFIKSMTKEQWEDAGRHWKLTWAGGQGIMPQNFPLLSGPVLGLVSAINDKDWMKVASELEPIQGFRIRDFMYALKYKSGGRYPIFEFDNPEALSGTPFRRKYELNLKDLLMRTFGPKPEAETIHQLQEYGERLKDKEIRNILQKFDRALVRGDSSEINRLFHGYPGVVSGRSMEDIRNDYINLYLTNEQRRLMQLRSETYTKRRYSLP